MAEEMMTQEVAEVAELSEYERERGKPMPSENHSVIELNISSEFRRKYRQTHSVRIEISLELGDVKATPDVCVFPKRPIDFENDVTRVTDPPLLAIEILSPTQSHPEVVKKIRRMLDAGVKACWFVQPTIQAVTVFLPNQKSRTITEGIVSDGVTGIELSIAEIFSTE